MFKISDKIVLRLAEAIKSGNVNKVREMLSTHPLIPYFSSHERDTFLHFACSQDEISSEIVCCLAEKVDVKCRRDSDGSNPLHLACANPSASISVLKILATPETVNQKDKMGCTPLFYLSKHSDMERVRFLLSQGASEYADGLRGACANERGDLEMVRLFLEEKKADVNSADLFGRTPILFAFENEPKLEIIELLLQKGADPNVESDGKSLYGRTPLHLACESKYISIDLIRLLLENGADPNFESDLFAR